MSRRRSVLLPIATATMVAVGCVLLPANAVARNAAVPTCHGHRATIFGSGTLVGTSHRDVIVGTLAATNGSEYQLIRAGAGNDLVCAGPAGSRVFGGKGEDRLYGERDSGLGGAAGDVLNGGPGDDLLDPGFDPRFIPCVQLLGCQVPGHDGFSFRGAHGVTVDLRTGRATGQGNDRLVVTPGEESLEGSAHRDVLLGTAAGDEIDSLAGADVVRGGGGSDQIVSPSGDDTQYGGGGTDTLFTVRGNVTMFGGPGSDSLVPNWLNASGIVTVSGGDGPDAVQLSNLGEGDQVSGDAGADVLTLGFDSVGAPNSVSALTGNLGTGSFTRDGRHATYQGFENWYLGSAGPVFVTGSDGPDNVFNGSTAPLTARLLGGDDRVSSWFAESGAYDDYVDGGDGTDYADLRGGSDVCINVELGPC